MKTKHRYLLRTRTKYRDISEYQYFGTPWSLVTNKSLFANTKYESSFSDSTASFWCILLFYCMTYFSLFVHDLQLEGLTANRLVWRLHAWTPHIWGRPKELLVKMHTAAGVWSYWLFIWLSGSLSVTHSGAASFRTAVGERQRDEERWLTAEKNWRSS